jgi:hypothetical protein
MEHEHKIGRRRLFSRANMSPLEISIYFTRHQIDTILLSIKKSIAYGYGIELYKWHISSIIIGHDIQTFKNKQKI